MTLQNLFDNKKSNFEYFQYGIFITIYLNLKQIVSTILIPNDHISPLNNSTHV